MKPLTVYARAVARLLAGLVVATVIAAGVVWACGPWIVDVPTVTAIDPPDPDAFMRGEFGVIRPRLRRAYLAAAYRVLSGVKPILPRPDAAISSSGWPDDSAWREIRERVLGPAPASTGRTRRSRDYVTPLNCLQDAIDTAVRTFAEREKTYGSPSGPLRDWVRAQDAVFANCDEEPLSLPAPAAANADTLSKADRAYQTAAAYFYAMQYDEAATRFRSIADDRTSPWRPYGRYLAARAHIRSHTMADFIDQARPTALVDAEQELLGVLEDAIAAPLHASARGLLSFVRQRSRPREALRIAANGLAEDASIGCCPYDLSYLLDREVGDTVDYDYASTVKAEVRDTHDLVDWVLAFQGQGDAARDRAVARWQSTKSLPWLVAALSKVSREHPAADALLGAASQVPASSAAFASVSFYRVRLLIALGRADAARAVLSALPDEVGAGASAETVNLYRSERLMVARTFDEWLRAAPRISFSGFLAADRTPLPIFDADAGTSFNDRLPLDRLVAAAESTVLPARLRARVATAAFTRAIVLDRHDRARRAAVILGELAPQLGDDLGRYLSAQMDDERRRAAIMLMLRTPGMTISVRGLDDTYSVNYLEPRREFANFVDVWWCAANRVELKRERGSAQSELIHLLNPSHIVPYPSFIADEERRTVERELDALDAVGDGAAFLAAAALSMARERPSDPETAEALGRIVNGWRRACRPVDSPLPRRAFQALHRQFPGSEWAKRTPYWYR